MSARAETPRNTRQYSKLTSTPNVSPGKKSPMHPPKYPMYLQKSREYMSAKGQTIHIHKNTLCICKRGEGAYPQNTRWFIPASEPYLSTQEQNVFAKEPYVSANEPHTSAFGVSATRQTCLLGRRALYICKRALNICKRGLCTCKTTLRVCTRALCTRSMSSYKALLQCVLQCV